MYNLNLFLKKSIIVIILNCNRAYAQGYTLIYIYIYKLIGETERNSN